MKNSAFSHQFLSKFQFLKTLYLMDQMRRGYFLFRLSFFFLLQAQLAFACSKSTIEPPEQSEICSKLAIKIPEQYHWHCSDVFSVNSEQISHIILVFLMLTLNKQMPAGNGLMLSFMESCYMFLYWICFFKYFCYNESCYYFWFIVSIN